MFSRSLRLFTLHSSLSYPSSTFSHLSYPRPRTMPLPSTESHCHQHSEAVIGALKFGVQPAERGGEEAALHGNGSCCPSN
ncbi:hypothetical protein PBY51_012771 [Eleginops maclovinus]|uniref:Uncharacterized protein n=1 Tax=Eleginops maclovinus TaxID=56733 RepID=A0AAN8AR31_ELEMC|nr:hypothetical protein PBY51_012771 [Eleginops maclovinus]